MTAFTKRRLATAASIALVAGLALTGCTHATVADHATPGPGTAVPTPSSTAKAASAPSWLIATAEGDSGASTKYIRYTPSTNAWKVIGEVSHPTETRGVDFDASSSDAQYAFGSDDPLSLTTIPVILLGTTGTGNSFDLTQTIPDFGAHTMLAYIGFDPTTPHTFVVATYDADKPTKFEEWAFDASSPNKAPSLVASVPIPPNSTAIPTVDLNRATGKLLVEDGITGKVIDGTAPTGDATAPATGEELGPETPVGAEVTNPGDADYEWQTTDGALWQFDFRDNGGQGTIFVYEIKPGTKAPVKVSTISGLSSDNNIGFARPILSK